MLAGMFTPKGGSVAGWVVTGEWVSNNNTIGWSGLTLRVIVPVAALDPGSKLRFTLRASNAGIATVGKVYCGLQGAGNIYDFLAAPSQLFFSGSPGVVVPTNDEVVSDPLDFVQDGTAPLVLAAYFSSTASLGSRVADPGGGWSSHYKSGDDAATVDASGYTASGIAANMFRKVEVFQP